jgi:hypothetical protein
LTRKEARRKAKKKAKVKASVSAKLFHRLFLVKCKPFGCSHETCSLPNRHLGLLNDASAMKQLASIMAGEADALAAVATMMATSRPNLKGAEQGVTCVKTKGAEQCFGAGGSWCVDATVADAEAKEAEEAQEAEEEAEDEKGGEGEEDEDEDEDEAEAAEAARAARAARVAREAKEAKEAAREEAEESLDEGPLWDVYVPRCSRCWLDRRYVTRCVSGRVLALACVLTYMLE